jgi:deoxyribonuclease (pyrimidine dimer)
MTRINSAIPVECLTDEHLLAEHREIKRLPYVLKKSIESGSINHIPENFTLGKGHVLFFLDKMQYTYWRYISIYRECLKRGLTVECYATNWHDVDGDIKKRYFNNYFRSDEEKKLLMERIEERIKDSPKKCWHYHGKAITKEEAIALLNNEDKEDMRKL